MLIEVEPIANYRDELIEELKQEIDKLRFSNKIGSRRWNKLMTLVNDIVIETSKNPLPNDEINK